MNLPCSPRYQSEKGCGCIRRYLAGYSDLESEDKYSGHRKWSATYLAPEKEAMQ